MILVDRGKLDPNDYVRDYLPAFACGGKEEARIRHLLTHTSGLPAYTDANSLKSAVRQSVSGEGHREDLQSRRPVRARRGVPIQLPGLHHARGDRQGRHGTGRR